MTPRRQSLTTTVRARAKINLRLEVLGLRQDRYHEISTIMHTLDLADELRLQLILPEAETRSTLAGGAAAVELQTTPDLGIDPHDNLAYRAAVALLQAWEAAGERLPAGTHLSIELDKHLPVAAGLGGGSADAAAVLRGLNSLLVAADSGPEPQWRRQMLAAGFGPGSHPGRVNLGIVAEALGSDVPFLLRGGAAIGTGRGAALIPLPSTLDLPVLLMVPPFGVRAQQAYEWWDQAQAQVQAQGRAQGQSRRQDRRTPPGYTYRIWDPEALADGMVANELTAVVSQRFPLVKELIMAARDSGALAAEMTGSGPVVFAVFLDQQRAAGAAAELAVAFPQVRIQMSRLDPAPDAASPIGGCKGER